MKNDKTYWPVVALFAGVIMFWVVMVILIATT